MTAIKIQLKKSKGKGAEEKDNNQFIIAVSMNADPAQTYQTSVALNNFPNEKEKLEGHLVNQADKFISRHAVLSEMNRTDLSIVVITGYIEELKFSGLIQERKLEKEKTM